MRLLACQDCHTQFDVTGVSTSHVTCPCGSSVENRVHAPLDLPIHRCAGCGGGLEPDAPTCPYCAAAVVRDPSRLGLVCPECYARTVEGGQFCAACGVGIRPQTVRHDGSALSCPVCSAALRRIDLEGVGLRSCPECGGSWVANRDFDAIVERVQARADASALRGVGDVSTARPVPTNEPVRYRACPECRQMMHRKNFGRVSGVIVDWCRAHGTWVDATELEAVAAFVATGGLASRRAGPTMDAPTPAESIMTPLGDGSRGYTERPTIAQAAAKLLFDLLS